MKYILPSIIGSAALVAAHGLVDTAVIAGKEVEFYQPYQDPYMNPGPDRISRKLSGNGPIRDPASAAMTCGEDSAPAKLHAKVAAGETVELNWTLWPDSHKGPVLTYMARCPDAGCQDYEPGTDAIWFKIQEGGREGTTDNWASTPLMKAGGKVEYTIPECLASGSYLVRHEIIALHSGSEFYPSCHQLEVTGSGSAAPSDLVAFPGAYKATDAGIAYSLQSNEEYPIPGPKLFTCGAGSAPAPAPTTAAPVPSASATAAPIPSAVSVAPSGAPAPIFSSVAAAPSAAPSATSAPVPVPEEDEEEEADDECPVDEEDDELPEEEEEDDDECPVDDEEDEEPIEDDEEADDECPVDDEEDEEPVEGPTAAATSAAQPAPTSTSTPAPPATGDDEEEADDECPIDDEDDELPEDDEDEEADDECPVDEEDDELPIEDDEEEADDECPVDDEEEETPVDEEDDDEYEDIEECEDDEVVPTKRMTFHERRL